MNKKMDKQRRQLLVWTAPTVAAVVIPSHASMSSCTMPPIVNVPVAPKCAGNPPIGTAQLEIFAPDMVAMELISISVTSSDPASTISIPSLPANLNDLVPLTVTWDGPASDAITCLPLAQIDMVLEYTCSDSVSVEESVDVTALLITSVP